MVLLQRFVLMLQFFTTIPLKFEISAKREDFGKGLILAPLIGLIIGILLVVCHSVFSMVFPPTLAAILSITIYIILTGGLHLDGLGDTADGFLSGRPRERILEIMKDSRVGTNGLLAVVIVLLLDMALVTSMDEHAAIVLLLMPVAGRLGSLVGSGASRYAGESDGPGRWCVEHCRSNDIVPGLFTYLVLTGTALGAYAFVYDLWSPLLPLLIVFLILAAVPPLSALLMARISKCKIGGVTGDVLGAICELNQLIFMMVSYLAFKLL